MVRTSILVCLLIFSLAHADGYKEDKVQTTGVFFDKGSTAGYNLHSTIDGVGTYLVDNYGKVLHTWTEPDGLPQGGNSFLTEEGTLLRSTRVPSEHFRVFHTGRIREYDWDGTCIWEFRYSNEHYRLHHGFTVTPYGNVVALALENYPIEDAQDKGFTGVASENPDGYWGETIVEVERRGYRNNYFDHYSKHYDNDFDNTCRYFSTEKSVVWKWEAFDHSQDVLDIDHFDINAPFEAISIDYLPARGHLVIDASDSGEVVIIDFRPNTYKVKGEAGNPLWRWGNPSIYGSAGEQIFFKPIGVKWVIDNFGWRFYENSYKKHEQFSITLTDLEHTTTDGASFLKITPIYSYGEYEKLGNGDYAPEYPDFNIDERKMKTRVEKEHDGYNKYPEYEYEVVTALINPVLSVGQLLPNGNVVINQLTNGMLYELTEDEYEIWRYVNPGSASSVGHDGPKYPDDILGRYEPLKECNDVLPFTCNGMLLSVRYSPYYSGLWRLNRNNGYSRRGRY